MYEPIQITQDPLVETLRPNDTILVQHFNPFYIENVTFASNGNEFLLKRTPCRELAYESQEINESLAILNVTKSAYEIATFYLLKGSLLTMTFEFEHTLTNYSVIASLYIYNKKSKFDNFLRNGPKSKTKPSQVFKSSNETLASVLNISQTNNYFIGLLIPQDSEVQEVHYNIRGNEIHYIETWAEPTCMLTPPTNGTCVMDFTNPHVNSEKDNICILGMNTGEEFAPLELKVNGNGYVNRVQLHSRRAVVWCVWRSGCSKHDDSFVCVFNARAQKCNLARRSHDRNVSYTFFLSSFHLCINN